MTLIAPTLQAGLTGCHGTSRQGTGPGNRTVVGNQSRRESIPAVTHARPGLRALQSSLLALAAVSAACGRAHPGRSRRR